MGLGFRNMIFGDPERKRREKQQIDLDRNYYVRRKAYLNAREQERIRLAEVKGKAAAQPPIPFYKKVIGAVEWVGKDLTSGAAKTDSSVLFNWDEKPKKRRTRKRRRKH